LVRMFVRCINKNVAEWYILHCLTSYVLPVARERLG